MWDFLNDVPVFSDQTILQAKDVDGCKAGITRPALYMNMNDDMISVDEGAFYRLLRIRRFSTHLDEKSLEGLDARSGERGMLDVVRRYVAVDSVRVHGDQHLSIHRQGEIKSALFFL